MSSLHIVIGLRLASLRTRRGWTVDALAIASAVSAEDISKHEGGLRMSIDRMYRLARALRVSPSAFFIDPKPLDRTVTPTAAEADEAVALIKVFRTIEDGNLRKLLIDIADHFAQHEGV